MTLFKKKNRTEKKENVQKELLEKISLLQQLARKGLLYVDVKERKVIISSTLAALYVGSEKRWAGFMENLNLWFVYTASQLLWNKMFLDAEVAAVREARKKFAVLTALQERTIRQQARAKIDPSMVPPPQIEPFDFIISSDIADGSEPGIVVVGRYDNGDLTMVPFDEVDFKKNNA